MYLLSVRNMGKLGMDIQSRIINSWHLCDTILGCLFIHYCLFSACFSSTYCIASHKRMSLVNWNRYGRSICGQIWGTELSFAWVGLIKTQDSQSVRWRSNLGSPEYANQLAVLFGLIMFCLSFFFLSLFMLLWCLLQPEGTWSAHEDNGKARKNSRCIQEEVVTFLCTSTCILCCFLLNKLLKRSIQLVYCA